jgi:hypothetical protein
MTDITFPSKFKVRVGSMCMTRNDDGSVGMERCNNLDNQIWSIDYQRKGIHNHGRYLTLEGSLFARPFMSSRTQLFHIAVVNQQVVIYQGDSGILNGNGTIYLDLNRTIVPRYFRSNFRSMINIEPINMREYHFGSSSVGVYPPIGTSELPPNSPIPTVSPNEHIEGYHQIASGNLPRFVTNSHSFPVISDFPSNRLVPRRYYRRSTNKKLRIKYESLQNNCIYSYPDGRHALNHIPLNMVKMTIYGNGHHVKLSNDILNHHRSYYLPANSAVSIINPNYRTIEVRFE